MANERSSSPLSSIPDRNARITYHHQAHDKPLALPPPPQTRKRSLPKPLAIAVENNTTNKRPRRQSKAELATNNLKKTYEENPLFQKPPQIDQPEPIPTPLSPQIAKNTPKPLDAKSQRNAPNLVQWKRKEPEQTQPAIQPRLWFESSGSRTYPTHLRSYGPLWEPPAIIYLVHNQMLSRWDVQSEPNEATPVLRKRMQTSEANLPYSPAMQTLSDMGWFKTKWNVLDGRENDRWGGWYDHIRLDFNIFQQTRLDDQQIKEYLPIGVQFPVALEDQSTTEKPSRMICHTLKNLWASDDDRGSLSLYAGPLSLGQSADGREEIQQERVTFQRFASCRLNTLIPDKAGFIFNAGAPVWSIDFLPAPELTQHSPATNHMEPDRNHTACDFLAVSTISSDPGLLPPTEIAKQDKDAKSVVQIWSVPHSEPTNFHKVPIAKHLDENMIPLLNGSANRCTYGPQIDQSIGAEIVSDSPQLVMLLAFPSQATVVRWCPRGGTKNSNTVKQTDSHPSSRQVDPLGLLAIAFVDGSVGLYSVPHPFHARKLARLADCTGSLPNDSNHAITLNLAPVAKLMLPSTNCLALDWANHDALAGGCTNGNIAIWHVETILQLLPSSPAVTGPLYIRPTHYKPVHSAPVKSISWIRTPPIARSGKPELDSDPAFLASTGYDGSVKVVDTQDLAASKTLIHERGETTSLAFSPTLGCLNLTDSDYSIKSICLKPRELGVSKKILVQLGLVWQIATSDFHSFIAYAAADGVCGLASLIRPQKFRSRATMWAPKVYQMDFSRKTSELRMLDNLKPQPRSQDGTSATESKTKPKAAANKKGGKTEKKKADQPAQSASSIGAFASIVSVHCLSWNKSITRGSLLASGMGSGLVRIDSVEGGLHSATSSVNKLTFAFDKLVLAALDNNNSGAGVEEDDED
ncbi:hypothetical protein PSTG_14189 [Puccinia striiformis f. sp. tritici PST-78]|uniref:Uncharacterized protein n=1 Tax=Puccinia striiformis f. sp. tritici PST-78 TaxID=1165861 RepID=A0A0L0UZD9_9BASI|nr:hypothetical protein PSTG_14189 [Puccinia striiformis f. sp. tritici PST-78]